MPLQSNIIFTITGCQYISVFDAADFFHQWLLCLIDRHIFIVVSHRNQEQFNVAVIGFKNLPFYVQKKIDVILRVHRKKKRIYVDDIVVFNHILEKHISYLHSVFQLFDSYGISLFIKKPFLNYTTVVLLGQKIDIFDFIISGENLETISKLNFFYIFKNLETYLTLTGWLRGFVPWYTQKADVL